MNADRLLSLLHDDGERLIEVAARDLTAPVPGCAGWSVRDLVLHVAEVYQDKVHVLREGKPPEQWPPDFSGLDPIELLRESFAAINSELRAHDLAKPAWTWAADPSTGNTAWWVRRMAQETAVHRIDAEQALGDRTPIDPELAVDGVDEFMTIFLPTLNHYIEHVRPLFAEATGELVEVRTAGRSWLVSLTPDGVEFPSDGEPDLVLDGDPEAVLLWLWGREGPNSLRTKGEYGVLSLLRPVLDAAGQ